jgi:methionyl-tRNA synthetase
MPKSYLITTPIYYVNDEPHLGHTFTTLCADVYSRFLKNQGKKVFFLTGTDEHGMKIAEIAKEKGKDVKEFCDEISEKFKKAWKELSIEYDFFVRTTENYHELAVKKFIEILKKKNQIYQKEYEGLYCVGCEKFLTEKELKNGLCPDHKKKPLKLKEKNYFLKIKDKLPKIKFLIETGKLKIFPEFAKKEALGLLTQNLEDFSISRDKERVKWGIEFPGDKTQLVYVWFDALINYISAVGFAKNKKKFEKWWQKSFVIHFIGKDILKFHAIFWPAMLLSAKIKIPNQLAVHGFFTIDGQKMSKTLGNVIRPKELIEKFGVDGTRYLILSQFPFGEDGDIKISKLVEKYNADLAFGLGNLVLRTLNLAKKQNISLKKIVAQKSIENEVKKIKHNYQKFLTNFGFYESLKEIWNLIHFCNKYIDKEKPWEKRENSKKVILNLVYCIKEISKLLSPFCPQKSKEIKEQIQGKNMEPLFKKIQI